MTFKSLLVAVAVAFAQPVLAQDVVIETGEFRAMEVQENVQVSVTIAPERAVTARALDGDVEQLRMRQFLPWIVFDRDTRWLIFPQWRDDVIAVSVETPVLNGVKAFSGAQVAVAGDADARLWVETGDGGVINLNDVDVVELTLVAAVGGEIVATGACERLNIRTSGGVVDATGLTCGSVVVDGLDANVALTSGAVLVDEHPED